MLRDAWDHVHPCCFDMPLLLPGSSDESGTQVDNVNEGVIRHRYKAGACPKAAAVCSLRVASI